MNEISNAQRAIWSGLIVSLAAPFLTALIVLLLSIGAGAMGRGPDSLRALDFAGQLGWSGQRAVATFAWSIAPAVAGALALAALVALRGRVAWYEAVLLGAVLSSGAALLTGGLVAQHLAPIAAIGAVVGFVLHRSLMRAGIVGA